MVNFLKLIRYKNLLSIAFILFSAKYLVFEPYLEYFDKFKFFNLHSFFSFFDFLLLTLSIICIAAGGYVINDLKDVEADKINKPNKKIIHYKNEKRIFNIYIILTLSGLIIAILLAQKFEMFQLSIPHILSATLLYMYSHSYKKVLILGNLIIALLAALVPITYFLFESYSLISINPEVFAKILGYDNNFSIWNYGPIAFLKNWCFFLALFAFTLTLSREIIKDIEDKEGDLKINRSTIPIVFGNKLSFLIGLALLWISGFWAIQKTTDLQINTLIIKTLSWYFGLVLLLPSAWMSYDLYRNKGNAQLYSKIIKYCMLAGITSSILFYSFIQQL